MARELTLWRTAVRWRARLLGVAVGVSVYGLFVVLDFVDNPDPDSCRALGALVAFCVRGVSFLVLTLYGTPVLAVVAGLLAVSRRTRQFAAGFGVVVIVVLPALSVWLIGSFE